MKVKYSFRLPYRNGMETKPGYAEKVTVAKGKYAAFPEDTDFAVFKMEKEANRADFKQTDAELMEKGMEVLSQNQFRAADIASFAKEYSIRIAGAVGGITNTDKGLIGAMGELTKDLSKIAQAFTKKTGKAITVEEIKEILGA